MLAHVTSLWRNPRASPDFLAYPVHKACQRRVLGTWVPRCLSSCRPRFESQSSAGPRMQPYPLSPDLVWPAHLHGLGCLSVRAMDTGLPTVRWRARLVLGLVRPWLLPALAGAWDVSGRMWVAPALRLFRFGFGARVFGRGLQGCWWV